MAPSASTLTQIQANQMSGIIHGAPNPIGGATVTLYTTGSAYGSGATSVASTTTNSDGTFTLTLPTATVACPSGSYAYLGAYQGTTGGNTAANPNSLLMTPIGLCDSNYTVTGSTGNYVNTYTGQSVWIDELTTAVSTYALAGFMSVSNAGVISVGAPVNNTSTASATSASAAGLAHAFANIANIVNTHTGQPYGWTHGGTSNTTGGIIPVGELYLIGNILQSCVNSTGVTGTNTATANDGTSCGKLFSLVTPPQAGAAVPKNTLQAMLDLVKYPNPLLNTWSTDCTTAGSGTTTATSCLFGLAPSTGAPYANALTSAPPDWALAVVYASGYGANSTLTPCTTAGTCPGLTYPYYVALDYSDNVYVLNWSASPAAWTNIVGVGFDGTPIMATAKDTTNTYIATIGTDTAGHVLGANNYSTNGESVPVYSTSTASLLTTATYNNIYPRALAIDPANNVYISSSSASINVRKFTYGGTSTSPTYTVSTLTGFTPGNISQIGFDSNLDLYMFTGNQSSNSVYFFNNTGTSTTTPTIATTPSSTVTITGTTTNAAGLAVGSGNAAFAIDSVGVTPITKSGTTASAGSPVALSTVYNSTLYSRYATADGNNWVYSPDAANGSVVTGFTVFDSTDSLALGTYKGCYVISKACGTTAGSVPMYSPRGIALDSAGDVWVVSGASANLTELIGAAAPSWPGLSMAKTGLPQ